MSERIDRWIYERMTYEWCGNPTVPGDRLVLYMDEDGKRVERGDDVRVVATGNDGFDLMIGWPNRWDLILRRGEAFAIARFVIWRWWIRGEWCGLRRWIWYGALHRIVERHRQFGPAHIHESQNEPSASHEGKGSP